MTREEARLYYESEMNNAKSNAVRAEKAKDAREVKHYQNIAERAEWAYRALSVDYEKMVRELDEFQDSDTISPDQSAGAEKAIDIMKKYIKAYVTIEG